MKKGWIKAHRAFMDDPIMNKDSDHFSVWMYLLMYAAHTAIWVWFKGDKRALSTGQLVVGRRRIAEVTKVHESKVQRILKLFERMGLITQETSNRNRLITITHWAVYQEQAEDDLILDLEQEMEPGEEFAPRRKRERVSIAPPKTIFECSKSEQQMTRQSTPMKLPPEECTATASAARLQEESRRMQEQRKRQEKVPSETPENTHPNTTSEQQLNTYKELKNKEYKSIKQEKERGGNSAEKWDGKAKGRGQFVPPTMEEVVAYVKENNYNVSPNVWYSYYESTGWYIGKNKMRDWGSSIRTWHEREKSNPRRQSASTSTRFQPNLQVNEFYRQRRESGFDRHAARERAKNL